jgi:hypothetical protein
MQRLFIPTIFILMCLFSFVSPIHAANDQTPTVEFTKANVEAPLFERGGNVQPAGGWSRF